MPLVKCRCGWLREKELRLCCWCGYDHKEAKKHNEQPGASKVKVHFVKEKPGPVEHEPDLIDMLEDPELDWKEKMAIIKNHPQWPLMVANDSN